MNNLLTLTDHLVFMSPITAIKRSLLIFGYAVLVFLIIIAYGSLPNRWYHVLAVSSGSMAPTFNAGDMIIITPPPKTLKPGMILTLMVNGELVTHRLIEVHADGSIVTQGDANPTPDQWGENTTVRIIGLYRGRIPYLGYVANIPGQFVRLLETGAWFTDSEELAMEIGTVHWETPTPTPEPKGTSIEATKTAVGFVETVADANGSRTIYGVQGEICVTNRGDVPTQGLSILNQVEYKGKKGKYQELAGASATIIPEEQLNPGETRCYPYRIEFTPVDEAKYRSAAYVTIINHSGWLPGDPHCKGTKPCPTGPEVKADFDLPQAPPEKPEIFDKPLVEDTPESTLTPDPSITPETPTVEATPEIPPETSPTPEITPEISPTPEITSEPSPTPEETPSVEPSPDPTQTEVTPSVEPSPEPTQTEETPAGPDSTPEETPEPTDSTTPEAPTPDASTPTSPSPTDTTTPTDPSETPVTSP